MVSYFSNLRASFNSPESIASKNKFLNKYKDSNIYESQACYICDSHDWNIINNIDRYGFYYPTGVCSECGNIQQTEYYKEDVLTDFYSNFYRKIYGNQPPLDLYAAQKRRGLSIYKFVSSVVNPKTVLEVGVGSGGILSVFHDNDCKTIGLDYDEEYLSIARKNNLNVFNGSIEKLNRNDKFDLIILSHVLEHIVDPLPFLKKLSEHLTENGTIYIEVPSLNQVCTIDYDYDLMLYWQNAHTIHFTILSLRLLLKRAGFHSAKSTSSIHSCWQVNKTTNELSLSEKKQCLEDSMNLLNKIQRRRRISTMTFFKFVKPSRDSLISLIKFIRLHSLIKYIFGK